MRSMILLYVIFLNIFSFAYNVNRRFNRMEKRIFDGLDLDVLTSDMGMNKKSTERNFNILITIYDFMNEEQLNLRKDYYSILQRKISDLNPWNEQGGNVFNLYLLPDELLEDREHLITNEKISQLIKKETNIPDSIEINEDSEFYGHLSITRLISNLFNNKRGYNLIYKNFHDAKKFVAFNPPEIRLKNKPICIPVVTMMKIKNTHNTNIVLNSVFSDKYQISMFYIGSQKHTGNPDKSIYPLTISPGETLLFQIIILPDTTGRIEGNIVFNFNRKTYVLYPIQILVTKNIYYTKPIYLINSQVSKSLSVPIEIYNPHTTSLEIKEITNSFTAINLKWNNGELISGNKTTKPNSLIEIPSKEKVTLMNINFYKEFEGVDYGLVQIKTDKDVLIIPILVSVEIPALSTFPTYLDFGLIDLSVKVHRLIPLSVTNTNNIPVQLLSIFSTYDDVIEFIPNLKFSNYFNLEFKEHPKDKINVNNCIIQPGEKVSMLGYFLLNLDKIKTDSTMEFCKYGSLVIQTNFTNNPFIELEYSYCVTKNLLEYSVNGKNHRLDKNNFISLNYDLNKKGCIKYDINAKIKNINSIFKPFLADRFYYQSSEENENSGSNKNTQSSLDYVKYTKSIESIVGIEAKDNNSIFGENLNLFFAIVNPNLLRRFYHIPYKSSIDSKYGIIPIKINTNSLDFIDCNDSKTFDDCMDNKNYVKEHMVRNVNLKETVFISDFETIQTYSLKRKYFAFINQSDEDMYIYDLFVSSTKTLFELQSREKIERDKDHVYQTELSSRSENYCHSVRTILEEDETEPYECRLRPKTYMFFSVRINSVVEGKANESLIFYLNEKRTKFTLLMPGEFSKGRLTKLPSNFAFKPSFPGKVQTIVMKAISTYNHPIVFKPLSINDERIISSVIKENSELQPNVKQEVMMLTFDPSKQSDYRYFISDKSIIDFSGKSISYKDYYMWRENEKLWDIMKNNNRTTLNMLNSQPSLDQSDELIIIVRTSIIKPKLILENQIYFDLVKIGETQSKFIEVYNPSDQDLTVELFIASEDFSEINRDDLFIANNLQLKNGMDPLAVMDCTFLNFSEKNKLFDISREINGKNPDKNKNPLPDSLGTKLSVVFELNEKNSNGLNLTCKESDLIQIMLSNSSSKFKEYFTKSDRVLCDLKTMRRIEMLNTYKHTQELILADEFNRGIEIIRKMTDKELLIKKNTHEKFPEKIYSSVNTKITESANAKITTSSSSNQEFYLPKSVSSKLYMIKPQSKMKIGPIIFNPKAMVNSTSILFLKNDLTILYPIKLIGSGGSSILTFSEFFKETNSSKLIKGQIMKLEYDTRDKTQEFLIKVLRITNTGNIPLDIHKILLESENTSINVDYYGSISLKPNEKYDLNIYLTPDLTTSFIEKELKFISYTHIYSLLVQLEIKQDVYIIRNPFMDFNISEMSYHLYMIVAAIFILSVKIIYTITDEYTQTICFPDENRMMSPICASSKYVINNNPELKFENMFIKSFRKSNQQFYDEFKIKEDDKMNESTYSKLKNKDDESGKKIGEKVIDYNVRLNAQLDNTNNNLIAINPKLIEDKNDLVKEPINNKNIIENKENFRHIKPIVGKKQNRSSNKKPIGKDIIGLGGKSNDKDGKNDHEINFKNKKNNFPKDRDSGASRNDSKSNGNTSQNIHIISKNDYHNHSPWNKNRNSDPFNEVQNNRVKNPSKAKRENIFKKSEINKNTQAQPEVIKIVHIPEILPPKISEVEIIPQIPLIQPEIKPIEHKVMETENTNHPEIEELNNTIIADIAEKSFEEIFAEENILTNIGQKEGEEPLLINPALNQQFLSFNPLFLVKDQDSFRGKSKTNTEKSKEIITLANNRPDHNFIVYDVFAENEPKIENVSLIRNTISNVNKYNFADNFAIFDPVKPAKIKEEINEINKIHIDSENGEELEFLNPPRASYEEEDVNYINYESEKERIDSGAEEFKFNFNSIFTQHNVKLIDHSEYKEETTDNEDMQSGNQPYFNKNLIFPSFDFSQSLTGIFSSNPFASNVNRKLLDELREENIGEDYDSEHEYERKNLDEINLNEDSEEDPEWANEVVDLDEAGYFDETGTFKIRNKK